MELPETEVLHSVTQRYGRLLSRVGDELGKRPAVLPNGDFFPDKFRGDQTSVRRLTKRMLKQAGMSDVPLKVIAYDVGGETTGGGSCGTGGCGSGACAPSTGQGDIPRLSEEDDTWVIRIPAAELAHPVVLTANLARTLAHVFLIETAESDEHLADLSLEADFAAVGLGFGALLMQGAYIYSKSCGGPSIAKVTELTLPEVTALFALFASQNGHSLRRAGKHLDPTQRALLSEAQEWVATNDHVVELLRHDPSAVASGHFDLKDTKPLLVRWFGKKKKPAEAQTLAEMEALAASGARLDGPARKPKKQRSREDDELRSIIDEAFSDAHGSAETA